MNGPLILRAPFDLSWAWFCRILSIIEGFLYSGIIFPSEHSALLELGLQGLKSDRPELKDSSSLLQESWWKCCASTLLNQQVPASHWDSCSISWEVLGNIHLSALGTALIHHLPPCFCNHNVAKDLLLHIPDSVPEQTQAGVWMDGGPQNTRLTMQLYLSIWAQKVQLTFHMKTLKILLAGVATGSSYSFEMLQI